MTSPNVFTATDTTFATDVLQSSTPVLVDSRGKWCGPCKALAPMLEQLAADYGGRMKVAKVGIDRNPKTAMAYGVRSAPTMRLFKGGAVQATQCRGPRWRKQVRAAGATPLQDSRSRVSQPSTCSWRCIPTLRSCMAEAGARAARSTLRARRAPLQAAE